MNPRFTISSGPFNVPLVEHVVRVMGESWAEVRWNWELLKGELYAAFPYLERTACYTMAPAGYDGESLTYIENILVFIECDVEILKEICSRMGGEYLTSTANLKLWICRACPVEKACAVFAEKCPDRCVSEHDLSDDELQELQDDGYRAPVNWAEGSKEKLKYFHIGCWDAERSLGLRE